MEVASGEPAWTSECGRRSSGQGGGATGGVKKGARLGRIGGGGTVGGERGGGNGGGTRCSHRYYQWEGWKEADSQNCVDGVVAKHTGSSSVSSDSEQEREEKDGDEAKRDESVMVTLAGYCVHSTVVPAIVP